MKAKTLIGRSAFSKLPALKISAPSAKHRQRKFKQITTKGKSMAKKNKKNKGPAVPPQARQKAERTGTHARKAAEDFGSAAGAMANNYLGRAEGVWDSVS